MQTEKLMKRVECKFLLTLKQKEELLDILKDDILPDTYGDENGKYKLQSIYFDTKDLTFYREKEMGVYKRLRQEIGIPKKIKIRIRRYVKDGKIFSGDSKIFIEIKEKDEDITTKRRVKMTYNEALDLLQNQILPERLENKPVAKELLELSKKYKLIPQITTLYDRQAFFGKDEENGLRLTFDTNVKFKKENNSFLEKGEIAGDLIEKDKTILEVKFYGEFPEKIGQYFEKENILSTKISKYCLSIEKKYDIKKENSISENTDKYYIPTIKIYNTNKENNLLASY